jgi:hypothetical protein
MRPSVLFDEKTHIITPFWQNLLYYYRKEKENEIIC